MIQINSISVKLTTSSEDDNWLCVANTFKIFVKTLLDKENWIPAREQNLNHIHKS